MPNKARGWQRSSSGVIASELRALLPPAGEDKRRLTADGDKTKSQPTLPADRGF